MLSMTNIFSRVTPQSSTPRDFHARLRATGRVREKICVCVRACFVNTDTASASEMGEAAGVWVQAVGV